MGCFWNPTLVVASPWFNQSLRNPYTGGLNPTTLLLGSPWQTSPEWFGGGSQSPLRVFWSCCWLLLLIWCELNAHGAKVFISAHIKLIFAAGHQNSFGIFWKDGGMYLFLSFQFIELFFYSRYTPEYQSDDPWSTSVQIANTPDGTFHLKIFTFLKCRRNTLGPKQPPRLYLMSFSINIAYNREFHHVFSMDELP